MNQETSPQITLCIPLFKDESQLPGLLQNISSYFNKFQIQYEIIFILDPGRDQSEQIINESRQNNPNIHLIKNKKRLGRARSLLLGLQKASAPYIASLSSDLSVPLGEITKLLQNLIDSPSAVAFGTRIDKKDSPYLSIHTPKNRLEITYLNILREKGGSRFKDPFSSAFVMKKEFRDSLLTDLSVRGWYLTPQIQERIISQNLPFVEVPIHARSGHSRHFPYIREYLRLFFWSLRQKRI